MTKGLFTTKSPPDITATAVDPMMTDQGVTAAKEAHDKNRDY
jgi:hypothetical protein